MLKIDVKAIENQEFKVPFEDDYIDISLEFRQSRFFMSVKYKDKELNGVKLSSGVLMCAGKNFPFEIFIDDKNLGLDPFTIDAFESGLFDFYIIERAELEKIRGYEVE